MAVGNLIKGHFFQFLQTTSEVKKLTFQFNPETLVRDKVFNARTGGISEQINLRLIFDASTLLNQEEQPEELSILPFISALELLFNQQHSIRTERLFARVRRPRLNSLIGFSWGKRVFPVLINKITIVEQLFTPQLNPIYAQIDIVLSVLTIDQLKHIKQGVKLYYDFQQVLTNEASKGFSSSKSV
jgi:hypothetical protein